MGQGKTCIPLEPWLDFFGAETLFPLELSKRLTFKHPLEQNAHSFHY